MSAARRQVAVVTGGAVGIGAAIAEELGRRGAFVVTVDPGLALDGSPQEGGAEATTAQRIVDAGGAARAAGISVTDEPAVRALFAELVDEFGALDAVVNVAGISRPTGFASGTEADWRAVLDVHLNGYLTVLRAALPLMAAAGSGRILGVTSGSGWRAADAGAYSCAKRAVAALTWQVGRVAPPGVTVNALSPIAATRMVAAAVARQAAVGNTSGRSAASGGVSLGTGVPPPEHLGPIGAYLASETFSWSNGQVMFSNGSEVAWVAPPRLLEAARTSAVSSVAAVLDALGPAVLVPVETAQASNGGGNPRVGAAFDDSAAAPAPVASGTRCAVVTDSPEWATAIGAALTARGITPVGIDAPASGLDATLAQLTAVAGDAGPIDAVVVALAGGPIATSGDDWQRVLDTHAGITDRIFADAAWVRAASDYSAATGRPVRVVTVGDATTPGGWSRVQAAAQLGRSAHSATDDRVDAFAISVEAADGGARSRAAETAAYLVAAPGVAVLSGAELVVEAEWVGLRSHPYPSGTVTYGGPEVPDWVDAAVRDLVTGSHRPGR